MNKFPFRQVCANYPYKQQLYGLSTILTLIYTSQFLPITNFAQSMIQNHDISENGLIILEIIKFLRLFLLMWEEYL